MKLRAGYVGTGRGRSGAEGIALLYAVFAAFIAASMVTILLSVSHVSDQVSGLKRDGAQAQYLAEGAVEAAKKQIQTAIANWSAVPAGGSATIDGRQIPYTIAPTGFAMTATDESGIQTIVTGYEVRANTDVQQTSATVHRIINAQATPIFQFAVFYTNDLEIQPGPDMMLAGRVHSNRNMHLGSNATLTMNTNYVHAVGEIFRNRKDAPNDSPGTVQIRKWVANPFDSSIPQYVQMLSKSQLLSQYGASSVGGYDSNFTTGVDSDDNGQFTDDGDLLPWGPGALDLWQPPTNYTAGSGHTVMDAAHNIGEATPPEWSSISMYEEIEGGSYVLDNGVYVPCPLGTGTHNKGFYHANAGLSIIVDAAGSSWKAYDGTGAEITAVVTPAVTLTEIYDARQANGGAGTTKVLNINIEALATTGKFPPNGLIYAAHYGAGTGTNAKGIKLANAATLPAKLTVVSEDPVYIQGDYNINAKKGAAVIGDAINLLSNAWNGSKTHTSGLPAATNTVYNTAMVSGNQETSVGVYNGGLENLPRFHENWSGRNCTIRGSFVNAWLSRFATGAWVYGANRYTAPNRIWSYETAFNNVANLPPFTPMVVSADDIVSW